MRAPIRGKTDQLSGNTVVSFNVVVASSTLSKSELKYLLRKHYDVMSQLHLKCTCNPKMYFYPYFM